MKRIIWLTALVLGTLASLVLLWQFRQAVIVFLLSLATAAGMRPVISFFIKRGLKPGLALLLAYLSLVILAGGLFAMLGRTLLSDLEQITDNLTTVYEEIVDTWPESDDQMRETIANQLPPADELFGSLAGEEGRQALQVLIGTASGLAGFFGQLVVILILSVYWGADRVHFERLWLSLIPVDQRTRARAAWRATESGVGDYIIGEVVQSYLVGVILLVVFTWIGLPHPALLALISALAWFIPWLGAVLAIIPVVAMGLTVSPGIAIAAGLLTALTLALMELYVQPRFFARQRFNSLFLVLLVIMLAQVSGLIGLIVAPVLAAALQIAFQHFVASREVELHVEKVSEEITELRTILDGIEHRLLNQEQAASPEMLSLMQRLHGLLQKTTQYLQSTTYIQESAPQKTGQR